MGMPLRLLQSLAKEVGADVLRGMPVTNASAEETVPWEASKSVRLDMEELAPDFHRTCFAFPLAGYQQPLLPHQYSIGEQVKESCWKIRAWSDAGDGTISTVVLEASCEA